MPKKTRKAKIRASQRPITPGYVPAPRPIATPAETTVGRPSYAAPQAQAMPRTANPVSFDYGYVFRDLRRIGLLALFFVAVMLVLWFLIEVQHIPIIPGIV